MTIGSIKVWDIFVRIFHWSLVLSFTIAYLTEDDFLTIHTYAGYTIAILVSSRFIWGVIGGRYARFSQFVTSPKNIISYFKDVIRFRAKRYIGHNPAGGAMVIALIISLAVTVLFGVLTYGATEFSGPFAAIATSVNHTTANTFKVIHEFFANFTLVLVFIHVAGVAVASFQHKENLPKSMVTGYKKIEHETELH